MDLNETVHQNYFCMPRFYKLEFVEGLAQFIKNMLIILIVSKKVTIFNPPGLFLM